MSSLELSYSSNVLTGFCTAAPKKADASKAKVAAHANKKGAIKKRGLKVRTKVSFRRPHTLRLPRNPLFPRKAVPGRNKLDM